MGSSLHTAELFSTRNADALGGRAVSLLSILLLIVSLLLLGLIA